MAGTLVSIVDTAAGFKEQLASDDVATEPLETPPW